MTPEEKEAIVWWSSLSLNQQYSYQAAHPYHGKFSHIGFVPNAIAEIWRDKDVNGMKPCECATCRYWRHKENVRTGNQCEENCIYHE